MEQAFADALRNSGASYHTARLSLAFPNYVKSQLYSNQSLMDCEKDVETLFRTALKHARLQNWPLIFEDLYDCIEVTHARILKLDRRQTILIIQFMEQAERRVLQREPKHPRIKVLSLRPLRFEVLRELAIPW